MSSQSRINASRANGAKSHGPTTPEGKKRSSQNATTHGLFSKCVLVLGEGGEAFDNLMQAHIDHFQPNEMELGVIEQMCAAQWRLCRVMTMETQALNKHLAIQPSSSNPYGLAEAFEAVAASPSMALLQRYESRLQLMFQRAVRTLKLLRTIDAGPNQTTKNEPSPITEEPEPSPQPADSEPLVEESMSRSTSSPRRPSPASDVPPAPPQAPPAPPPAPPAPPPSPIDLGGDV